MRGDATLLRHSSRWEMGRIAIERFNQEIRNYCTGKTSKSQYGHAPAAGACLHAPKSVRIASGFIRKIGLLELLMGVETPIPPKMTDAAAPDGAPPRRIPTVEIFFCRFSWFGCEPDRFMLVSPERRICSGIPSYMNTVPESIRKE